LFGGVPRAETFLSTDIMQKVHEMAHCIFKEERARINPSAVALLDALAISEVNSLRTLGKEVIAHSLSVIEDLLKKVKMDDDETGYIARCLMDVDTLTWVQVYGGSTLSERTIDMHLIGPCARTPGSMFIYGENHSNADCEEKRSHSDGARSGKPCDFIFMNRSREGGVGENTGPKFRDHHDKAKTNFMDIIKVARAQHIQLQTELVQQSGFNPLPPILINGDIFAFWSGPLRIFLSPMLM
ncbi:11139_t:CDS:2, partial [Paraglomus occultum]